MGRHDLLTYVFHIGAGTIALAAGLVAAFALKGSASIPQSRYRLYGIDAR